MKTTRISHQNAPIGKSIFLCVGVALALLISCNKEEDKAPDFTAEDTESANSDAVEESYFDDTDDVSTEALAKDDSDLSGGKTETDERLACATVTREGNRDAGTLRINFGDGCKDPRGNLRRGVIVVVHEGRWNAAGSRWNISYQGYSINGVSIEGSRNVTVTSATDTLIISEVVLKDGRMTWPDGRVATREVNRRREHHRHENNLLDRLIIYGTATGTLRNGRGYTIEILEPLIYRRACAASGVIIPVSGKKLIKHGDRELTVDYGDGTCDNIVILTNKNGKSVRHEVDQD
jgi:hypothetical protein